MGRGGDVVMSRMNLPYYDHNHYACLAYYISTLALFHSHILLLQCLSLESMSKSYEV